MPGAIGLRFAFVSSETLSFGPAVWLVWLFLGCAHAQPPPEPPFTPPVLLPRSSIAAILAHRGDLQLTDEQVQRLEERDDALEQRQAALRTAFARPRDGEASRQRGGQEGGQSPAQAAQPPGMGMGGGRRHGQRMASEPTARRPDPKALENQLDDNDMHAYLAAEAAVLTEKQRDPAREIAEQYREALYDQRDQAARRASEGH
jgi:hypothetical protein